MRFQPSQHSEYGASTTLATSALSSEATLSAIAAGNMASGASAGAAAGGAAAVGGGGGHVLGTGFLGLNWRAVGASILIGTCVAVGTDLVLSFLKPRLFQRAPSTEKK